MYLLQRRQGQSVGVHCLILFLNSWIEEEFLHSVGTISQIFGAKNVIVSVPYQNLCI